MKVTRERVGHLGVSVVVFLSVIGAVVVRMGFACISWRTSEFHEAIEKCGSSSDSAASLLLVDGVGARWELVGWLTRVELREVDALAG